MVQRLFDSGICGGKSHARYLQQLGFPPEKIGRFYDVVDNCYYQDAADEARRSTEVRQKLRLPECYFLYVGRLAPEKNINGLLDAFARYRRLGGSWSLVLVGDGPEKLRLQNQTELLGIGGWVQFAGLKNTRETTPYYALAGCFVLPSLREPWGLVVNEAMASGLPVIVSERCGCAEDLVATGRNGFVFDPSRKGELSDRLFTVSAFDEKELSDMGRQSREIVAGYSPQHWAAEVARLVQ
jgi:glycosyltransferase involved in cell wall biosynthesis